jgi:aminoglycoside 6'-N-acetyltransferase I
MRKRLWPEVTDADNVSETAELLGDARWAVFVCEAQEGLVGFVEARLREYAEGCSTSPVGFIEGWYVESEARGAGVGRSLVEAAEAWARSGGCTEMASDSLATNVDGHRAHEALGYTEVERLVCFRKSLD